MVVLSAGWRCESYFAVTCRTSSFRTWINCSCSIRFCILFKRTCGYVQLACVLQFNRIHIHVFLCPIVSLYIPYVRSTCSISLSLILYCVCTCIHYTTTYTSTRALTNLSLCCTISQTFPTCVWIVALRQAEAGRSTFLALSSLYSLSLVSRTFAPVTLRVNSVSL